MSVFGALRFFLLSHGFPMVIMSSLWDNWGMSGLPFSRSGFIFR